MEIVRGADTATNTQPAVSPDLVNTPVAHTLTIARIERRQIIYISS